MTIRKFSRKGEGYVDVCVGIVAFVMVLVISINIFEFVTLRVEMDQVADELIESATFTGCFGDEFNKTASLMKTEFFDYQLSSGADKYFNTGLKRVQLGDRMWVTVSVKTNIKGLGIKIPITLNVKKSGISEKYWK